MARTIIIIRMLGRMTLMFLSCASGWIAASFAEVRTTEEAGRGEVCNPDSFGTL